MPLDFDFVVLYFFFFLLIFFLISFSFVFFFFFQAEDGIRDLYVTGVQTCALPISLSIRGSRIRHICSAGDSFVNLRSRTIASRTWLGVGQTPPLLRLISVRSVSNAR